MNAERWVVLEQATVYAMPSKGTSCWLVCSAMCSTDNYTLLLFLNCKSFDFSRGYVATSQMCGTI